MMLFVLIAIVVIAPIFAAGIYRHNGKKEILRFDLVQFIYGFVMGPIAYVWLKTFLFFNLRNELNASLTINQLFLVDSIFSVFMIYLLMANAIHSLTKTFWLRKKNDPEFDLFHLSEYFHLWLTHIVIFGGLIVLLTLLATVNIYLPFSLRWTQLSVWGILLIGVAAGIIWSLAVLMSDPKQQTKNFIRLFKLMSGIFFIFLVGLYFAFDPHLNSSYVGFWLSISTGFGMITGFMLFNRSRRMKALMNQLLHSGWGENVQIKYKEES
jgi:hypothetical protein